jgi:hypothetical protein
MPRRRETRDVTGLADDHRSDHHTDTSDVDQRRPGCCDRGAQSFHRRLHLCLVVDDVSEGLTSHVEAMLGHLCRGFDPVEDLVCPGHRHFLGHAARFELHQQRMQPTRRLALRAAQIAMSFHQQLQHSGVIIEHHPAERLVA